MIYQGSWKMCSAKAKIMVWLIFNHGFDDYAQLNARQYLMGSSPAVDCKLRT